MKRISVLLFALIAMISVNAQSLQNGDNAINLGIGVPRIYDGEYNMGLPAFVASWQHGWSDKVGIGYISGGIESAISTGVNKDVWDGHKYHDFHATYISIGPRAAYHFDFWSLTRNNGWSKFDVYAGVFGGITIKSYNFDDSGVENETKYNFTPDLFIGMRYSMTEGFGFFSEVGANVSYLSAGIAFRF